VLPGVTVALRLEGQQPRVTVTGHLRVNLEVFNLGNAMVSDIDYYFTSRLPGEPLQGVADIHTHPTVPRTVRVTLALGF
jgi:hypothetical protein